MMFRVRATFPLLTPFLPLTPIERRIHLSIPSGESSKMTPTLTVNCCLYPLHHHSKRVRMKECSSPPHRGHVALRSGQRRLAA